MRLLLVASILSFLSHAVFAADSEDSKSSENVAGKPSGEAFVFYVENDARGIGGPGSDNNYSNGVKVSYIFAEDKMPNWAERPVKSFAFLDEKMGEAQVNFGISLGHQIYTPRNTSATNLIQNDRPYAGWLYLGFAAAFKQKNVGHFVELDIGVVGPSALGEEVQNNFHDMINTDRAKGWKNGLKDEFALQFSYQKRYKYWKSDSWDLVPYFGLSYGNVLLGAHLGGMVRAGVHLPDDFGPTRPSSNDGDSFLAPATPSPTPRLSYYVFTGSRGNITFRNIFLDGNSFQKSHRVTKYPFTFETELGVGLQYRPWSVIWRYVTRSPEFEERSIFNSFASVNLIYSF